MNWNVYKAALILFRSPTCVFRSPRTPQKHELKVKPEPARINNSKGSTRRRWACQYPNVELTPIRYEQRTTHGTWSYKHSLDILGYGMNGLFPSINALSLNQLSCAHRIASALSTFVMNTSTAHSTLSYCTMRAGAMVVAMPTELSQIYWRIVRRLLHQQHHR